MGLNYYLIKEIFNMIQTLALLGLGYLIGNEPAQHKVEIFLKKALSNGLSNFKGAENVAKNDETFSPNGDKSSTAPIITQ
jgi:hypothetical protein